MMTTTNISNEEMDKIIQRFQALDALRSCHGASDGEKQNATDAIDSLLRRNGLDVSDIAARLNSSGAHSPFYMGADPKYMREWKIGCLDTIAKAYNCRAVKYHDESSAILFGARFRVNEATALYKYLVETIGRMADQAFAVRTIRFGDGVDSKAREWQFSFHLGALDTISERLMSRQQEPRDKRNPNAVEPRDMSPRDIEEYMEDVLLNKDILKALHKMFQRPSEREEEPQPTYNPLGFYAGRQAGLSLSLQAEVAA